LPAKKLTAKTGWVTVDVSGMAIPTQITGILEAINGGDREGVQQLFPLVYDQLRKIAHARMGRSPGQTLQTTALVHELYLRLLHNEQPRWENRRHFFSIAAEAMRRILIENARRRASLKRGGNRQRIPFHEDMIAVNSDPDLILSFDQALTRLHDQDPVMEEVVKLRCFAGLTIKETALALGVSTRNVDRQWSAAKAWLYEQVAKSQNNSDGA
jgi:RNA polymerase sigma factor (TIGR02999 family)